ncbi:unknown [Sutterella sp. CAG:351]|nr:unknown [Sutterella sp. CAG:351]
MNPRHFHALQIPDDLEEPRELLLIDPEFGGSRGRSPNPKRRIHADPDFLADTRLIRDRRDPADLPDAVRDKDAEPERRPDIEVCLPRSGVEDPIERHAGSDRFLHFVRRRRVASESLPRDRPDHRVKGIRFYGVKKLDIRERGFEKPAAADNFLFLINEARGFASGKVFFRVSHRVVLPVR